MRERARKLQAEIRRHDHLYHDLNQPEIEDYEYDMLLRDLIELETKCPELIRPDSPTQRVGGSPSATFAKVVHRRPMLSLEFVYDETRIRKFDEGIRTKLDAVQVEYSAELKFDGVAVSLIYVNGSLEQGATRGDGLVGDNITQNLRRVQWIPESLPGHLAVNDLEVRGEVVMFKSDFQALRERQRANGEKESPNPRNAAAGSLRQLDSKVTESRKLHFFPYAVFSENTTRWETQFECLTYLREVGFQVAPECKIACGLSEVLKYYEYIRELRDNLRYQIDGVVFKVNRLESQRILGSRPKEPYFAIARKFPPERKETQLIEIDVQVGRTGALTPVARVKPVFVGGVTIRNVTLHNENEILEKHIWIGDTVVVQRAGDVIPEIVEIVSDKRPPDAFKFQMPTKCKVCGSTVVKPEGEAIARCSGGLYCPAQRKQALWHFASRKAMNIVGLGYELVTVLVDKLEVREPADIYSLGEIAWKWIKSSRQLTTIKDVFHGTGRAGPIYSTLIASTRHSGISESSTIAELENWSSKLDPTLQTRNVKFIHTLSLGACPKTSLAGRSPSRLGEKGAEKLEREINKSKIIPLDRFIYALGIRHVGDEIARLLARECGSIEVFLARKWEALLMEKERIQKENERKKRRKEPLSKEPLRGVGERILQSVASFLAEGHNLDAVHHLLAVGVSPQPISPSELHIVGPFAGKKVVFTGSLDSMPRSKADAEVRRRGGDVVPKLSEAVDYLIVGRNPGSKLSKGESLGIEILKEDDFRRMLGLPQLGSPTPD